MTEPRKQKVEIPGYKIVDTLGEGGMATVYLAIQESFEREVALKVMSASLSKDSTFGERFIREARIVSRLIHPNIVTVYDVGVHQGHHFLSMEYVPGQDLKHKRFELSLPERLQVIRDTAAALDYAGRKGYVHRDVKPDNIMLRDEDGRAVLMDFGIARPSDVASGMTQVGTTVGTPHYMSPEQARGEKVDNRSDLYSLGVVLFLLISGDVPYDAESAVAVGIMHVSESIPRLPEHLKAFQPIIDKVLAKKADQRYQTGGELMAALDAIPAAELNRAAQVMKKLAAAGEADRQGPSMLSDPATDTVDTLGAVGNSQPDAPTAVTPSVPASVKAKGDTGPVTSGTPLTISEDERLGHLAKVQRERDSENWWGWVLPVLLIVGLGVGTYAYLQWRADPGEVSLAEDRPPSADTADIEQAPADDPAEDSDSSQPMESLAGVGQSLASPEPDPLEEVLLWNPEQVVEQLTAERGLAPEMLTYFGSLLDNTDADIQAAGLDGLARVQAFYLTQLQAAREDGDTERAATLADEVRELFSDNALTPEMTRELADFAEQRYNDELANLLARGRDYLASDALSVPAGANALEMFNAVLERDPDNAEAREGIARVGQRYVELAAAQLRAGNHDRALSLIAQGREIAAGRDDLGDQRQRLAALQRDIEAERDKLQRAREHLEEGRLVSPSGENAWEIYRQILDAHPEHALARRGQAAVAERLERNIAWQIDAEQFSEAADTLALAREHFPREEGFLSLQVQLNEARDARQPRIQRLRFSSSELDSLSGPQAETINVDRVIHIGFAYSNFGEDTSVVQAVLYDGSRSLQIATVPVILDDASGERFFRIERQVTGFAEGGYHIDLMLGGEPLVSASFRVKN